MVIGLELMGIVWEVVGGSRHVVNAGVSDLIDGKRAVCSTSYRD